MKSLILSILLILTFKTSVFANPELAVRGKAPKWSSGTSTQELSKICDSEKNEKDKVLVCNAVVSRYSKMKVNSLPKESEGQAKYLIQIFATHPNDSFYTFGLHDSHQTLGLRALSMDNLKVAKEELLKSIQVPVVPALQTIGPRFNLAEELLKRGEKSAVIEYLSSAEKILTLEETKGKLQKWREIIVAGKTPSFK